MEEQPWFLKIEFWTALVTALVIFLGEQFGIELSVEHIVGIIGVLVAFFWKKSKDEDRAAMERMMEKEIQLEVAKAKRLKLEK
ncbi:MAG: hypothetical protein WCS33_00745 [Candidatus Caldatribacteriota bacterium]|jgi:small basic protein